MILRAKNRNGKKVIARDGKVWSLLTAMDNVTCIGNVPGLLIKSELNDEVRWLRVSDDPDFDVVKEV